MPSNNKAKMKIFSSLITLLLQKEKKTHPLPPQKKSTQNAVMLGKAI